MKKLSTILKGRKHICFIDFEGTQFSHEMIAFGACFATLTRNGLVKRHKEPIRFYVTAKNKVGKIVEELTGISDYNLKTMGIPFSQALKEIKKYCGLNFSKCLFATFGTHDFRIFNQSIAYNIDADKDIASKISKSFFDVQAFLSDYIKDDHNNCYSLENYLKLFDIPFEGTVHDPKNDAYNLMVLYDTFLKRKDVVLDEYIKLLGKGNKLPEPVKNVMAKLAKGEDVSYQDFVEMARKELE